MKKFAGELERALDAGDVASLQLRLKSAGDDEIRAAARTLMPIALAKNVAFIMNDRPDLARELECDGVHVGQNDTPYAEARAIVGPKKIVGVTCHNSRHLALEAAEAGADYVAFGAFFPTTTKDAKGIGGITAQNAAPLIDAGADFLAVSSGVWDYADGAPAAVRAFNQLFAPPKR